MKIAIKAEPRSVQGTGASRRLRRESKVPGVVYGAGKDAQAIELDHKDLWFKLKTEAFHASILDMEIGSVTSQVLLRDYQMHPFKPLILHADFQRVAADKKIHMSVPLHFTNEAISPGVKVAGGLVEHVMRSSRSAACPRTSRNTSRWTSATCRRGTRCTFRRSSCRRAWRRSSRRARIPPSPPS